MMMRLMIVAGVLLAVVLSGTISATLYRIWSRLEPSSSVGVSDTSEVAISLNAAKREFDSGDAIFLDARGLSSYIDGHILGALYLPAEASSKRRREVLASYSRGTRVITYCAGAGCRSSDLLARALRDDRELNLGDILVLEGGFPAWKKAGYPVATGREREP